MTFIAPPPSMVYQSIVKGWAVSLGDADSNTIRPKKTFILFIISCVATSIADKAATLQNFEKFLVNHPALFVRSVILMR